MSRKQKPRLGQNFLSDLTARQRIADALGDISAATVLEIGPGHGAITEILATRARRLIAIELDRALAAELRFRFRNQPSVEILEADILTVDLPALLTTSSSSAPASPSSPLVAAQPPEEEQLSHLSPVTQQSRTLPTLQSRGEAKPAEAALPSTPTHIIGNLPYYITSDILLHLFRASLAAPGLLTSAVLMMQREVADRVASPPGRRDFGLLSATTQMHAVPGILFTLGPESFSPPPEVGSTVLRLRFQSRFAELGVDPAPFDGFLHHAFAQKRKTLAKNLRNAGFSPDQLNRAWLPDLDPQIRAEATALDDLAALHRALSESAATLLGERAR